MKNKIHAAGIFCVCAATLLLASCKKDDDQPEFPQAVVNEPEEITTVELHFTKISDNSHFDVVWADKDGPGGDNPVVGDIELDSGATYKVEAKFLDESGESPVDITAEIKAEDDEHIICFEPEGDLESNLEITRIDSDGKYEIGLESSWEAKSKAGGELHMVLKHQPGVKDGNCEPGETDVEVHFDLTIK